MAVRSSDTTLSVSPCPPQYAWRSRETTPVSSLTMHVGSVSTQVVGVLEAAPPQARQQARSLTTIFLPLTHLPSHGQAAGRADQQRAERALTDLSSTALHRPANHPWPPAPIYLRRPSNVLLVNLPTLRCLRPARKSRCRQVDFLVSLIPKAVF